MVQDVYGFPVYPGGHLQLGLCPITVQSAVGAQLQGFWHFWLIHAKSPGQSGSEMHCGRSQLTRGFPKYVSGQWHRPLWLLSTRHRAFKPHWVYAQGSVHSLLTHAWLGRQSMSERQPTEEKMSSYRNYINDLHRLVYSNTYSHNNSFVGFQ